MLSQLSGSIGHYSSFLHKNTSETLTRCITIDQKTLVQIRQNQYWGCSQPLLQLFKVSLALLGPHKLSIFLQQSCHRLGKFRETFYEPSIVSSQSQETLNLSTSVGGFEFNTSLTLLGSTAISPLETT